MKKDLLVAVTIRQQQKSEDNNSSGYVRMKRSERWRHLRQETEPAVTEPGQTAIIATHEAVEHDLHSTVSEEDYTLARIIKAFEDHPRNDGRFPAVSLMDEVRWAPSIDIMRKHAELFFFASKKCCVLWKWVADVLHDRFLAESATIENVTLDQCYRYLRQYFCVSHFSKHAFLHGLRQYGMDEYDGMTKAGLGRFCEDIHGQYSRIMVDTKGEANKKNRDILREYLSKPQEISDIISHMQRVKGLTEQQALFAILSCGNVFREQNGLICFKAGDITEDPEIAIWRFEMLWVNNLISIRVAEAEKRQEPPNIERVEIPEAYKEWPVHFLIAWEIPQGFIGRLQEMGFHTMGLLETHQATDAINSLLEKHFLIQQEQSKRIVAILQEDVCRKEPLIIRVTREITKILEKGQRKAEKLLLLRSQGKTLQEIGRANHLTRERVRQICMKASGSIKHILIRHAETIERVLCPIPHILCEDYARSLFGESVWSIVCYVISEDTKQPDQVLKKWIDQKGEKHFWMNLSERFWQLIESFKSELVVHQS